MSLLSGDGATPRVVAETADFAALYKPARMHCAPALKAGTVRPGDETLLEWYAGIFPAALGLRGKKPGEGGLLHRLDFETRGLVLFAKNQRVLDALLAQQASGNFVKEYSALCREAPPPPSFPPPPEIPRAIENSATESAWPNFSIESFFRAFGPGRKETRPVTKRAQGALYRTEVTGASARAGVVSLRARLSRGFRHQVRCHLAWIGWPILDDPLYGAQGGAKTVANGDADLMAFRAEALFFDDPADGARLEIRL